ncbi:MAG: hypothetical protein PF517_14625 [Salinivirgaceae bacterium]|jgi:hypothetical protein|nr:hypothetical protein [Salinivirgaceae bacterium]
MNRNLAHIAFGIVFLLYGCELDKIDYPVEPQIESRDLTVTETDDLLGNPIRLNTIHFYLIDGDGDIGPETPCYNGDIYLAGNCLVELYYKSGNSYMMDTSISIDTVFCGYDTVLMNVMGWYAMPYSGDLGQDKALKADIFIDIEYNTEPQKNYEEFFYTITVFDKSLNQSNTISTDTIIITQ